LSFWFAGKVIDKIGHARALIVSNIYSTLASFVALIFPTIASPAIMTTTSLAFGLSMVSRGDLMNRQFTDQQRATMGSLVSLASSIAYAIVAVGIGYIADITSPITAMLLALSSNVLVVYFYWRVFKV
jgi:MFS family permease